LQASHGQEYIRVFERHNVTKAGVYNITVEAKNYFLPACISRFGTTRATTVSTGVHVLAG